MIEPTRRDLVAVSAGLALGGCASSAQIPAPPTAWRRLNTEAYPGKQDDISFVTPDLGWYGNGAGKLYRTQDGGESWEKIWEQPGTFIRALAFVDANEGYLGNVGVGYYPNVSDAHPLYRTRDGGATWSPVEAEGIGMLKGVCGIDILHRRRIYQGELRPTTVIHAAGRVGGPAAMLRSVDGGETWQALDLSAHAGMILDVKFFSADEGLVCAASSADLEQANALVLRTRDGGATWATAYRGQRVYENCWKMNFPSRRVGYATVQSYNESDPVRVVIKTIDGGATWRELPMVSDAAAREFGVGFVNEDWGWVGASGSGYETRDGGASWAPVEMGRAVNKIRILRDGPRWRAFAIGVTVHRLDGFN